MEGTVSAASFAGVDMKLEVIAIPVSDVDRAKDFYTKLGWRLRIRLSSSRFGGKYHEGLGRPVKPIFLKRYSPFGKASWS